MKYSVSPYCTYISIYCVHLWSCFVTQGPFFIFCVEYSSLDNVFPYFSFSAIRFLSAKRGVLLTNCKQEVFSTTKAKIKEGSPNVLISQYLVLLCCYNLDFHSWVMTLFITVRVFQFRILTELWTTKIFSLLLVMPKRNCLLDGLLFFLWRLISLSQMILSMLSMYHLSWLTVIAKIKLQNYMFHEDMGRR